MKIPAVTLAKDLRRSIGLGHPWIYDRAVKQVPREAGVGDLVRVRYAGRTVATGYLDPKSPIRVRVLSVGDGGLDPGWVRERARSAAVRRQSCRGRTNAIRALHGEGDGTPGLVIDVYDDTAVAVFDGDGARALWQPVVGDVANGLRDGGLDIARVWHSGGGVLIGDEPPETIEIFEVDARFGVQVRQGHKTGWFIDQRENRLRVGGLSRGRTVLNLFGYTGGFSVHAALGGATRVTTVDIAAPAIEEAVRNFGRSGLCSDDHEFKAGDVMKYLSDHKARRFDIVICDPPSYAASAAARDRALSAYRKLNTAAASAVAPGGLLVTASCSSHVTEADFMQMLALAWRELPAPIRIIETRGAGSDHPTLPGFPEGDYLKVVIASVG